MDLVSGDMVSVAFSKWTTERSANAEGPTHPTSYANVSLSWYEDIPVPKGVACWWRSVGAGGFVGFDAVEYGVWGIWCRKCRLCMSISDHAELCAN
jgi:hypothetical protein